MEKRYQVFVSSTYSDLKDERRKVIQTLMEQDCIPAGMELFPAMDLDQFEFIKRVIDDCDYYILIVGARYGSMDSEGISYTEKEYDYAVLKGIPIMAFLHKDINSLPIAKADLDDSLRTKLESFRKKIETGRLVRYWRTADELDAEVAKSLPKTIKLFPRPGWVKATVLTKVEALQEINMLRKENDTLKAFKEKYINEHSYIENIADWDEIFDVHFTYKNSKSIIREQVISNTWIEWFKEIALELDRNVSVFGNPNSIKTILEIVIQNSSSKSDIKILYSDVEKMKYQLLGYDVIQFTTNTFGTYCSLTTKGKELLIQLMSVKTKK